MTKQNAFQFSPLSHYLTSTYLHYLDRAANPSKVQPDFNTLRRLMHYHVYQVPWENLTLWYENKIITDIGQLIERFVNQHLGGVCYQLNVPFATLLYQLGFTVRLHACLIYAYEQTIYQTPRLTHVVPIVTINNQRFLADVAWLGLTQPIILTAHKRTTFKQHSVNYFPTSQSDYRLDYRRQQQWMIQYQILNHPLLESELQQCMDYSQHNPEREVQNHLMFSKLIPGGRMMIQDNRLNKRLGHKTEEIVLSDKYLQY